MEGITGIELEEVVSQNDEVEIPSTAFTQLIGILWDKHRDAQRISSNTGVADETARAIGVGIVRKF